MKTGLIAKFCAALALAGSLLAPAGAARADTLESAFDHAFAAHPAPHPAIAAPRPAMLAPVAVQPQTSQRFTAPPPRTYASGFEAQIAQLASSSQGRIGVAALDLGTGRSLSVLGSTPFPMASTIKVAIVATYLQGVDDGRLSLNSAYPLLIPVPSRKFSSAIAPVRQGAALPVLDLIEMALTRSDNHAADTLLSAVGGPAAVNQWLRSVGVQGIHMDRDIATLVRDDGAVNPANTIDTRDSATPQAMVDLVAGLYQGRFLSQSSRSVLLGAMQRCITGKHRIRALLPDNASVLDKTGTLANTASDVGIINTPDGRAIAVAIYVTGQGGHAGRNARIATIAKAIYDDYLVEGSGYRRTASR